MQEWRSLQLRGTRCVRTVVKLKSCIKGYKKGTHRAVHPEETFKRVNPKLPAACVTQVSEITGLDRIGIPVFICTRPTAEEGATSVCRLLRLSRMMKQNKHWFEIAESEDFDSVQSSSLDTDDLLDDINLHGAKRRRG